jgi:hypothetical protein
MKGRQGRSHAPHISLFLLVFPRPAVIEEELGRPAREIFAEISEQPVAAASLGQVYKVPGDGGEGGGVT